MANDENLKQIKVLTEDGLRVLFEQLGLGDYVTNSDLIGIINAIEEVKADKSQLPTKVSQLSNDAGYLTEVINISGNAATATKLRTAVNINGVAFDGSKAITVADSTKVAPSGSSFTANRIATFADTTGKTIKDSGFTIATSVPANAKFTDTTYSTGTASALGLTKLYTGTGTATDGTMTQSAIKTALDGKAASSHTHSYLPLSGGTLSGILNLNGNNLRLTSEDTYSRLGYEPSTKDVFISNSNNNFFRLRPDQTIRFGGKKVYSEVEKPTAEEVGAVAKTGDTMTGLLTIDKKGKDEPLLRFDAERGWEFKQLEANADARLGLVSMTSDKNFEILPPNLSSGVRIRVSDTQPAQMTVDGGIVTDRILNHGEFVTTHAQGLRIVQGQYGTFFRNDGTDTFLMITNPGDTTGTYGPLRPFRVNHATGMVYCNEGITGNLTGNATTATRLRDKKTITINGDSKEFDGTQDLNWNINVGAVGNSVQKTGDTMTGILRMENANYGPIVIRRTSGTNHFAGIKFENTAGYLGSIGMGDVNGGLYRYNTNENDRYLILDQNNYRTVVTPANIGAAAASHTHNYVPTSDYSLTTISKTLTLTTSWQDTGITGSNLSTGTYIVQVSGMNSEATSFYQEIWSGTMSWFQGTTNSTDSDEIILHKAGHASNGRTIYLRTIRTSNSGYLKLQIASSHALSSSNITFKFRKLI